MINRPGPLGALGVSLLIGCGGTPDAAPPSPSLEAAIRVAQWLLGQTADGVVPDRVPGVEASGSLGSGAAGHALFFAELFAASGDSVYVEPARASARTALARAGADPLEHGLYNGLAGVAAAVVEVAALTGSPPLRADARRLLVRVASAYDDGVTSPWGDAYDVLTGWAGIGLALLYAHETLGDDVFRETAVRTGDGLLRVAERTPDRGLRWMRGASVPLDLPNFSHGTAGVGFFMARLAAVTGEARFRQAALAAAAYLDAIADRRDGLYLVPYGVPNDGYVTQYDVGWAHGPAGTSRLHYALWQLTGDPEMRDRVDANARTLLATGMPGPSADSAAWSGPFRIDRRFGTSGAAVFLMDWGLRSQNPAYLEMATRIVDDVVGRAMDSGGGLFWRVPLYGFQGPAGQSASFTGYFYGSAGLGLALLRHHYVQSGRYPRARLPDDPFPRDGWEGR